jgi:hypothetical protein
MMVPSKRRFSPFLEEPDSLDPHADPPIDFYARSVTGVLYFLRNFSYPPLLSATAEKYCGFRGSEW